MRPHTPARWAFTRQPTQRWLHDLRIALPSAFLDTNQARRSKSEVAPSGRQVESRTAFASGQNRTSCNAISQPYDQ